MTKGDPMPLALNIVKESRGRIVYFVNKGLVEFYKFRYGLLDRPPKFYYSKQTFDPGTNALYFRPHSYLVKYLDLAILRMMAMHIRNLESMYDDDNQLKYARFKLREEFPPVDMGLIEMKHLITAWKVIGTVGGLAVLIFLLELIMGKIVRPRFPRTTRVEEMHKT